MKIPYLIFIVLSLLNLATSSQYYGFLDPEKIVLAINCGYNYYYQDQSGLIYRPDSYYIGGQNKKVEQDFKQRPTIFSEDYDWFVHQTERTSKTEFQYEIPIKMPGDYVLLFLFHDSQYKQPGERLFNVLLEKEIILSNVDIIANAGGPRTPYAEFFEFSYLNERIRQTSKNKVLVTFQDNSKKVLKLSFVKVKGQPKLDALILFQGTRREAKLKDKKKIFRSLSEEEFSNTMQSLIRSNKDVSNEGIFILKHMFLNNEVAIKDHQSIQTSNNSNAQPERPQQFEQHGDQINIFRTIDQIWIIEDIKTNMILFFNFFGQNFLFLLLLSLNFVCMFYCYRSKNVPKGYENQQYNYKLNKMMQANYNLGGIAQNYAIYKSQKLSTMGEDNEKQNEPLDSHVSSSVTSTTILGSNSKRLKKK